MKKYTIIHHGNSSHSTKYADDCIECIEIKLEYYRELKKAGGVTNMLKKMKKKVTS